MNVGALQVSTIYHGCSSSYRTLLQLISLGKWAASSSARRAACNSFLCLSRLIKPLLFALPLQRVGALSSFHASFALRILQLNACATQWDWKLHSREQKNPPALRTASICKKPEDISVSYWKIHDDKLCLYPDPGRKSSAFFACRCRATLFKCTAIEAKVCNVLCTQDVQVA